jgi:protein-disulfide isomerase
MKKRLGAALLLSGMGLAAQGLVEGRAGSPVRVVIYEDLQCPDCANFRVMLDKQLLPKYASQVEFVHRDFPLAKHAWARRASVAARYFTEKDAKLGLEYRQATMAMQKQINADNIKDQVAKFAKDHGLKPEEALAALDNQKYAELVEKDYQEGVGRGIVHTPTALVNGTPFIETFTFEEISKGIDDALAQTK